MEFFLSPLPLRFYCVVGSQQLAGFTSLTGYNLDKCRVLSTHKIQAGRSIFRLTTMEVVRWQLTKNYIQLEPSIISHARCLVATSEFVASYSQVSSSWIRQHTTPEITHESPRRRDGGTFSAMLRGESNYETNVTVVDWRRI